MPQAVLGPMCRLKDAVLLPSPTQPFATSPHVCGPFHTTALDHGVLQPDATSRLHMQQPEMGWGSRRAEAAARQAARIRSKPPRTVQAASSFGHHGHPVPHIRENRILKLGQSRGSPAAAGCTAEQLEGAQFVLCEGGASGNPTVGSKRPAAAVEALSSSEDEEGEPGGRGAEETSTRPSKTQVSDNCRRTLGLGSSL